MYEKFTQGPCTSWCSHHILLLNIICSTHPVKLWRNTWEEPRLHARSSSLYLALSWFCVHALRHLSDCYYPWLSIKMSSYLSTQHDELIRVETLRHPLPLCWSFLAIPTFISSLFKKHFWEHLARTRLLLHLLPFGCFRAIFSISPDEEQRQVDPA